MANSITPATRVIDLTVGQLESLITQWTRAELQAVAGQKEGTNNRRYVYGLKGLAKLLGCSKTRACQINTSGAIAPALTRLGNLMIYDADMVLTLLQREDKHKK
jgi:hypothetical protein